MRPAERMQMVLDYLHLGTVALAVKVGLSRTRIRDLIRNDAKMAADVADAISMNYPTISREWLLFEKGEMLVQEVPEEIKKEPSLEDSMKKLVNEQLVTNAIYQKQIEFMTKQLDLVSQQNDLMAQQNKLMAQQNKQMHEEFVDAIRLLHDMGIQIAPTIRHDMSIASEPSPEANREFTTPNREFTTPNRELANENRELSNGNHELANGNRELANGNREFTTPNRELSNGNRELANGNRDFTTPNHELATPNHELANGNRELSNGNREFSTENRESTTENNPQ